MSASRIHYGSHFQRQICPFGRLVIICLSVLLVVSASTTLVSQNPPGTDLQFHKFQPKVAPEQAAPAASIKGTSPNGISLSAMQQIQALQQEKASRSPAQQKVDSNVLYTIRMLAGQAAAPGVPYVDTGVDLDRNDNIVVDIVAHVTDQLLQQLKTAGAQVLYTNRALRSIRAVIPPQQIEHIASSPDVIFIWPKQGAATRQIDLSKQITPLLRWKTSPDFKQRAARVRQQLATILSAAGTPIVGQGSVETEGDFTHRALDARGTFGVDGTGLKIGVLSDGVTSLALSQGTGDLPATCGAPPCMTVLPGQVGGGDEGTAMLEIIHDMAPGASLYFATAFTSITSFAQNIRDLRTAGCDIIVDDVFYFVETPFQDGQAPAVVSTSNGGVVTQAVNDVVADGALYFSSAGNEGNEDSATSGTYEGDFVGVAAGATLPAGDVHDFGGGTAYDTITSPGTQVVGLWWADPLGASSNDYDLYVLNSTGTTILAASTNIQSGTQDPIELLGSANVVPNNRLIVFQNTAASDRFFHLGLFRGTLAVHTAGETHGHSAASGAYTVAAAPAAGAFTIGYPTGPYPDPFNASNELELFTSDGPRHIFFAADSTAITPGDFSSTGGTVLQKPDITGADGVSVTGVGGFGSPFYGTSAAAPSSAAVAALVKAAQPTLTPAQVRTVLTSTAIDIMAAGFDRDSGNGIVMAWDAINSLGVPGYANPALSTITAGENPGNANGVLEAGEGGSLVIGLKNTAGVQAATGITSTLTASTAKVYITLPGTSAYADMAAGASGGNNLSPFTFTLDPTFPCGQTIEFALTVTYTGGPQRTLNFAVPTGMLTFAGTLGTQPPPVTGVTTATGTQTDRISRNGVVSACGAVKSYPGTFTSGPRIFDSYSFTACQAMCLEVELDAPSGINLFTSAYSPSFDPANISTNYAGDAGASSTTQTFSIDTAAATNYTIVVNDVPGTQSGASYTLQIPVCALNCNANQLPIAVAQDVTVTATSRGGTADANIDNGSSDPDGDTLTLSQVPPGPYAVGTTSVRLNVVDTKGATAQATANVTVLEFNQAPVALAHDVTVIAANTGGTADANIDNGSSDPDGDAITLTQTPAGPYAVGTTSVTLTVQDALGASTQATANVTVADPGFGLAATQASVTVTAGQTATQHITFSPNPGTGAATTFTCSGLPAHSTCTFAPTSVPAGAAQTDVVLTIATTAHTASLAQPRVFYALWLPLGGLALIGMMAMPGKRRRALGLLLALLVLGLLMFLSACGNDSPAVDNGTPRGTSTVTVHGTSGNVTQTTTFSLTVN